MNALLAVDGSNSAKQALQWLQAFEWARTWELHVVSVVAPWTPTWPPTSNGWLPPSCAEQLLEEGRQSGQAALREATHTLRKRGFNVKGHLRQGEPATAILNLARDLDVELIIAGRSPTAPWLRWLTGSVSRELLAHWGGSLVVVPAGALAASSCS
jgi:nucleotide-binding universal stress UspA family protein